MQPTSLRLATPQGVLAETFTELCDELGLTADFPPEVEAEARRAIAGYTLPDADLTALPFLTIDPPDALDLDQALHLARDGSGYRVWYAIADLPGFVAPGGAIDLEARRRGQTMYPPTGRLPLHPETISESAASLLPGAERGAYVWEFGLDAEGRLEGLGLTRARIRSRQRFDYQTVQDEIDGGAPRPVFELLREIGLIRLARERERGGASLGRPSQEIVEEDGRFRLIRRVPLPVESWNAQLSLLTGMAAARVMVRGRVGILRTLPLPDADSVGWFRRQTRALGHPWEKSLGYGEYLGTLDATKPAQLAILHAAASLFRGAGYVAFDGELPANTVQAAVAAPYAHATAPLRRLVDRFTLVSCEALLAGREVPAWVREALPELPGLMESSDALAGRLSGAAVSATEAAVLAGREGERFEVTVLERRNGGGMVQLTDPAVTARTDGEVEPGTVVTVELVRADVPSGEVLFDLVRPPAPGADSAAARRE